MNASVLSFDTLLLCTLDVFVGSCLIPGPGRSNGWGVQSHVRIAKLLGGVVPCVPCSTTGIQIVPAWIFYWLQIRSKIMGSQIHFIALRSTVVSSAGWAVHYPSVVDRYLSSVVFGSQGKGTALHHAAAYGHVEAVKMLLERGASPYAEDNAGHRPGDKFDAQVGRTGAISEWTWAH